MKLRKILTIIVFIALVMVIGQTVALAAVAIPDITYVRLWPEHEGDHLFLIEATELNKGTTLPADVNIAIPKGATVMWVGEVFGGDSAKDIETPYKINHEADYDEVVFTLNKGWFGQVEFTWNEGLSINGTKRELVLDWVQRYPSKGVVFEFREPSQATNVKIGPLAVNADIAPDGSKYYQTQPVELAVGQKQQFRVSYERGESAVQKDLQPQGQNQKQSVGSSLQSTGTDSFFVLGVALVVVVLIMFMFKARSMTRNQPDDEEYLDEENYGDIENDNTNDTQ